MAQETPLSKAVEWNNRATLQIGRIIGIANSSRAMMPQNVYALALIAEWYAHRAKKSSEALLEKLEETQNARALEEILSTSVINIFIAQIFKARALYERWAIKYDENDSTLNESAKNDLECACDMYQYAMKAFDRSERAFLGYGNMRKKWLGTLYYLWPFAHGSSGMTLYKGAARLFDEAAINGLDVKRIREGLAGFDAAITKYVTALDIIAAGQIIEGLKNSELKRKSTDRITEIASNGAFWAGVIGDMSMKQKYLTIVTHFSRNRIDSASLP